MLAGSMATLSSALLAGAPRRVSAATLANLNQATRPGRRVAPATSTTLSVNLKNNTGSDTVYAFVTGLAISNNNALMLLESDGQTPYYPPSPPGNGTPLGVYCAIKLNKTGASPRTITIPYLAGARLWVSIGAPITFLL